jgi:hypothetical protein
MGGDEVRQGGEDDEEGEEDCWTGEGSLARSVQPFRFYRHEHAMRFRFGSRSVAIPVTRARSPLRYLSLRSRLSGW